MKTRRVINFIRPTDIPENWEIYNAPRPLYGTLKNNVSCVWQGEFISGVFYAAINPGDPDADRWRKENVSLDAIRLESVTSHDIVNEMVAYYQKNYSADRVEKIFNQHPLNSHKTQEMLIQTWFNLEMNWKE